MRLFLGITAVLFLLAGCASSSPSKRAPVNGWHRKEHRDVPAGYHTNGSRQTPF